MSSDSVSQQQAMFHGVAVGVVGAVSLALVYRALRARSNQQEPETKHTSNFDFSNMMLIGGSAHPKLAQDIANHLGIEKSNVLLSKFSNGETRVEFKDHCRGKDVYIVQSMVEVPEKKNAEGKVIQPRLSLNDILMETILLIGTARGSSAHRVTLLMPMAAYPRQDKKEKARVSVVGRLVAKMLETAGIDRAVSVDLHSAQIQGFYGKPLENIYCESYIYNEMRQLMESYGHTFEESQRLDAHFLSAGASKAPSTTGKWNSKNNFGALFKRRLQKVELNLGHSASNFVVISPHASGAKRATRIADKLGTDCAVLSTDNNTRTREQREGAGDMDFFMVGDVKGKVALLADDLTDTGRTLMAAANFLKKKGAIEVHSYVLHAVLSAKAIDDINDCHALSSLTVTNSLPQAENAHRCPKLKVIDISPLLAEALGRLHLDQSLQKMYKYKFSK